MFPRLVWFFIFNSWFWVSNVPKLSVNSVVVRDSCCFCMDNVHDSCCFLYGQFLWLTHWDWGSYLWLQRLHSDWILVFIFCYYGKELRMSKNYYQPLFLINVSAREAHYLFWYFCVDNGLRISLACSCCYSSSGVIIQAISIKWCIFFRPCWAPFFVSTFYKLEKLFYLKNFVNHPVNDTIPCNCYKSQIGAFEKITMEDEVQLKTSPYQEVFVVDVFNKYVNNEYCIKFLVCLKCPTQLIYLYQTFSWAGAILLYS